MPGVRMRSLLFVKFLEYYRLQNQIFSRLFLYISLPLGRACYTLLIYVSAIHMPGDTQQGQRWTQLLSISQLLLACVWQRHRFGECNKLCQGVKKYIKRVY